jgi:SAM-dependent methyltransferase
VGLAASEKVGEGEAKVVSVNCRTMTKEAPGNRWLEADGLRGGAYDERFARLAATGQNVHGEADLVGSLGLGSVLDAGCGTGRVAIELARRGLDVVGIDLDPQMLAVAREKDPVIAWVQADLSEVQLGRRFEGIVMAGNVMIFVTPGTEGAVVANLAGHLEAGGLLVAGFSLVTNGFTAEQYDTVADAAGLDLVDRWASWDRQVFGPGADYAVSVHRQR